MMLITLLSILHDPDNHLPIVDLSSLDIYNAIVLKTDDTPDKDKPEFSVYSSPRSGMANARREVLALGLELTSSDHFFYVDYDRLVFWLENYPEELQESIRMSAQHDLSIYGRTHGAIASHPNFQRFTEIAGNEIFNNFFGSHSIDVLAGTRGISRRLARYLIDHSAAQGAGLDFEWPFLAKRQGFSIQHYYVNGLAWEGNGNRSEEDEARLRVGNLQDMVDFIYG